jgi:hypothetical protein
MTIGRPVGPFGDFRISVIHGHLILTVWPRITQHLKYNWKSNLTTMEVATAAFVNMTFPNRRAVKEAFTPLAKLLHSDKGGKDHLFAQVMTVKTRAMLHFEISTDPYLHSHDAARVGLFEDLCKKNPGAQEQHVAMWEFEQSQAVGTRYPATILVGTLAAHPFLYPAFDGFFYSVMDGSVRHIQALRPFTHEKLIETTRLFQIIRRHFEQWRSPGFLKPVDWTMWADFLSSYQYGDPDLSAMPCYEELNPAPILHEHVYSHITIPELMKIYPSLNRYQEKPPLTVEHVAALRSAEANEFAAKQVPDLRTRLERQQAATLRAKEALAAEEQKCKELQAQLDAQARPADRKGQKTALEKEKQALAAEKQALEERDAALRAAMKEFDAKVEALAVREAAMEEKESGERVGGGEEVPEKLKNVAVEVKPFDTTATIRKQIDAQQAVLAKIFRVFEDVDVQDCKFKITHVAKNLLALEGNVTSRLTSHFAETLRYRLPSGASVIKQNKVVKFATFNDIVTAAVGCASIPTFNNFLAHLRQMGVATDLLASAAFGQHARSIYEASSVTFCAIRGIPHEPHRRLPRTCNFIIRGGMKQCPRNSIKGSNTCARHTTTKRRRVA